MISCEISSIFILPCKHYNQKLNNYVNICNFLEGDRFSISMATFPQSDDLTTLTALESPGPSFEGSKESAFHQLVTPTTLYPVTSFETTAPSFGPLQELATLKRKPSLTISSTQQTVPEATQTTRWALSSDVVVRPTF